MSLHVLALVSLAALAAFCEFVVDRDERGDQAEQHVRVSDLAQVVSSGACPTPSALVARAARALGLAAVERNDRAAGARGDRTPSRWLVIARSPKRLQPLLERAGWRAPNVSAGRVWTDDYSNVLSVVKWSG